MGTIQILMATYNGDCYIEEQINSIIRQQTQDCCYELIFSDDGSTDQTIPLIEKYLSNYPGMLFYRKDNLDKANFRSGPCGNFSFALSQATSEYVMFSDQDDVWETDKVEKTYSKMKELESQCDFDTPLLVFTDLKVVDHNLNTMSNSFFKYQSLSPDWSDKLSQLVVQNVAPGCTMMVNRALLDLASPIPREAIMHDWWLMLVAKAFGKIAYLDEPTILYRQHENNQVGAKSLKFSRLVKNFNKGCNNLFDASVQAKVFVERYEAYLKETLDDYELDKIKCFSNFHHENYINNLSGFLKAKYRKNNVLRNLGLLAAIHRKVFR
ncbi:TPA: glycosyltransferase family 2 protein [Vibrio cholerae]|nr:glycosyltransferase family 2 protein [Vibrio cholerae]HAS3590320.1 glycosyltransferase family 2 protein [Vibrio cholerae]